MDRLKGKIYLICAFSLVGTSVISARFVTEKLGIFTITAVSPFLRLCFWFHYVLNNLSVIFD